MLDMLLRLLRDPRTPAPLRIAAARTLLRLAA